MAEVAKGADIRMIRGTMMVFNFLIKEKFYERHLESYTLITAMEKLRQRNLFQILRSAPLMTVSGDSTRVLVGGRLVSSLEGWKAINALQGVGDRPPFLVCTAFARTGQNVSRL